MTKIEKNRESSFQSSKDDPPSIWRVFCQKKSKFEIDGVRRSRFSLPLTVVFIGDKCQIKVRYVKVTNFRDFNQYFHFVEPKYRITLRKHDSAETYLVWIWVKTGEIGENILRKSLQIKIVYFSQSQLTPIIISVRN